MKKLGAKMIEEKRVQYFNVPVGGYYEPVPYDWNDDGVWDIWDCTTICVVLEDCNYQPD